MQSSITIFVIISHFHHLMPGLSSFVPVFQIKAFLSVLVIHELGALTANFKVEFDINKKSLKSLFQSDTYVFKIGANSQRLAYSPVLLSNWPQCLKELVFMSSHKLLGYSTLGFVSLGTLKPVNDIGTQYCMSYCFFSYRQSIEPPKYRRSLDATVVRVQRPDGSIVSFNPACASNESPRNGKGRYVNVEGYRKPKKPRQGGKSEEAFFY